MRQLKREIGKLISYAKAHGLAIYFHTDSDDHNDGAWSTDGSTIYVYAKKPLRQYLVILHELSHNRQFIQDGRSVPFKTDKAYQKEGNLEKGEILNKKYRKIIYETEKRDSRHQLDIHYETQSTIPVNIVQREIEYDLWIYQVYYKTGHVPSKKESAEMRKSLTKKWKSGKIK